MKIRALLAVAGLVAAGLVATSPAQAAQTKHLTFTLTVTSTATTLHTMPGDVTYGWNRLVGKTTWGKRAARVEFLGQVSYVNGSGPFGGLVTVTRAGGTSLGFSVTGFAMSPPVAGTDQTRFRGTIEVLGGTGAYEGATGIGVMTGHRKAALGSPVTLTFDLNVRL
jgi:hypothetical protein